MYEEFVKDLRLAADPEYTFPGRCFDNYKAFAQAADAIEELSRTVEEQKAQIITMAAEGKPQWISVEERLPEEDGNYLVNCSSAVCESNFSIRREAHWLDPVEEWEKYEDVTHWMALPEPPQEVNNGT